MSLVCPAAHSLCPPSTRTFKVLPVLIMHCRLHSFNQQIVWFPSPCTCTYNFTCTWIGELVAFLFGWILLSATLSPQSLNRTKTTKPCVPVLPSLFLSSCSAGSHGASATHESRNCDYNCAFKRFPGPTRQGCHGRVIAHGLIPAGRAHQADGKVIYLH